MIRVHTMVRISDNSGAIYGQCIKVLKNAKIAKPGDIIIVVVKKNMPHKKIKRGSIHRALLIRTSKALPRYSGHTISFTDNSAVLLGKRDLPVATRIMGPVYKELREKKYMKVISLSTIVV